MTETSISVADFLAKVANKRPFNSMHPRLAAFFREYLANEKVVDFNGLSVLNTHFPPWPGPAFDNLVESFDHLGDSGDRRLYSVTWAVTNRCNYRCWHCYNAGREERDITGPALDEIAARLRNLAPVVCTISGGEPLLRDDLERIAGLFGEKTCLKLNTTGEGLTRQRARALRESGIFAMGLSLDSMDERRHDRLRGMEGAFRTVLMALEHASAAGLYPYIVSVATDEFIEPGHFWEFMDFARGSGAREVHLLEPSATGRLAGKQGVLPGEEGRQRILQYQEEVSRRADLPVLSSFTYLESADAFGCGAGLTHLYIDGTGEVSPCNLVPLSFGNATREKLERILDRMGEYFRVPRMGCVGHLLSGHIPPGELPVPPAESARVCREHLPREHPVPRFFSIQSETRQRAGREELRSAYDSIGRYYDDFWLTASGGPTEKLMAELALRGNEKILEAGCGTGFATALLAESTAPGAVTAVDLSGEMLRQARGRTEGLEVDFIHGDALEVLKQRGPFDIVFSSWVLGYIPLGPFFAAAYEALRESGKLAFIVHRENSPREPLEIFGELVMRDPSVVEKHVSFDFPVGMQQVKSDLEKTGFRVESLREGEAVFTYGSPDEVLEHLLKSGAGTAFYNSIRPDRRQALEDDFLRILGQRHDGKIDVVHDYVAYVAVKPD